MKSAFAPRDVVLLCVLALLWGHSFLFIKTAVGSVGPVWIVVTRMMVGGLLLLAIAAWRREPLLYDGLTLAQLGALGVLGSALPWAGQAWAQGYLDSGLVAVLNGCTPLATLVLAVLAKQERLQRHRVIGIAVAIVGTLLVVGGEVGEGRSVLALTVAVLATFGYAFAAVFTRAYVSGRIRTLPAAALQLLIGAIALMPVATALHGPPPTQLTPVVAAALFLLGTLGTGISFYIYFTLIGRVGATNTAMVTYLIPIVALAAGAFYRDEHFGPNVFVGAATLIAGVWLAQRNSSAPLAPAIPKSP